MKGTVKWYDAKKGIGYVYPDGGTQDAYINQEVLDKAKIETLKKGQRVEFYVHEGPAGLMVKTLLAILHEEPTREARVATREVRAR